MAKSYSVTSEGVNPAEDRAHRMRMYFIAMSLRVVCVVSLFWVRGWWVLLAAAGAVILPWFAVLVGNAVAHGGGQVPDAPQPLRLTGAEPPRSEEAAASDTLIVIDVEPERRSAGAAGSSEPGGEHASGDARASKSEADPTRGSPDPDGDATAEGSGRE